MNSKHQYLHDMFDAWKWVEIMKKQGYEFCYTDGKECSCMMFDKNEEVVVIGWSEESLIDAIADCANNFAEENLMKMIEGFKLKDQQKANMKAVNEILGIRKKPNKGKG